MTTKRKQILKAIAARGCTTLDDLVTDTGLLRKNLHDNLKAALKEFLVDRIRDDVTGLPAYKLTMKGRAWLVNNEKLRETTQAMSGDVTIAAADDATSLASASPGQAVAVVEPPTPDDAPVAVRSDESALSKSVTEFCEWVGKRCQLRTPRNLREAKDVIEALEQAGVDLAKKILGQDSAIKNLQTEMLATSPAYRDGQIIGYAIIPDSDGMIIHANEASARDEAAHLIVEESDAYSTAHLVAIIDTAEMQISWKNAA